MQTGKTTKRTSAARGGTHPAATVDKLLAPLIKKFLDDPKVSQGRMFGATGLKVAGKVFAMLVKGKLVVKLPKERVDRIVTSGRGEYFDPGHGRPMKEWVAMGPQHKRQWLKLSQEARGFVAQGKKGGKS